MKDIPAYNAEMSRLYQIVAYAFTLAGALCLIFPPMGVALIISECSAGIYALWRAYQKILCRHMQ